MLEIFFVPDIYAVIYVSKTFYNGHIRARASPQKARLHQFFTLNLELRNGSDSRHRKSAAGSNAEIGGEDPKMEKDLLAWEGGGQVEDGFHDLGPWLMCEGYSNDVCVFSHL